MEIKSLLIKDTTKEERIRIVQEGLNQCGGACDFCNGCDNVQPVPCVLGLSILSPLSHTILPSTHKQSFAV